MRSLRTAVVASFTGVALASGMLAATSAEATSATITTVAAAGRGCTSWTSGQTGNIKCTGGSQLEIHRAAVTCMSRDGGGLRWEVKGPWKQRGLTSSASCAVNRNAVVASIRPEHSMHG
ncbi:hypothetical protein SALBM311S_09473 [Streptomyces alboniger]